jgi:hypothetical protein
MFGESEGGAMKMAKKYQKPDYDKVAIGWIGRKPSKEEFDKWNDGMAVGGNSSEVVCIPFMLDTGGLNAPIDSDYRKNLIQDMYTINGIRDMEDQNWFNSVWVKYLKELERLKSFISKGEELRLWISDAPYSLCGFYYVCTLLCQYKCKASVIELPRILSSKDLVENYGSWNEIPPGKFYQFLSFEKELTLYEINKYASYWIKLEEDKNKLRTVVNGHLIGVPDDFYDFIIRNEIPEEEFTIGRLVGTVLGKYQLGVGDWWYVRRILYMIDQKELIVLQKQEEVFGYLLKKA